MSDMQNLLDLAGSSVGKDKLAETGGSYIRDRLREVSYFRKILPPKNVTKADCQRSTKHDTLIKIRDIEPQSRAMSLTFRGRPDARYITGKRYEIAFHTISSEKYEKIEEELLAYEMPVTQVIEDNTVKDLQECEDRQGTIHLESCVQATQEGIASVSGNLLSGAMMGFNASNLQNGDVSSLTIFKGQLAAASAVDDFVVHDPQRRDFITLFNGLDSVRLKFDRFLITEPDWNRLSIWSLDDFGDRVASETVVDGFTYSQLLGRKAIRTIKTDILREGNIYGFTSPEFLGDFYILNDVKFYIDKIQNLITWVSWMNIGIGIGNVRSVVKMELYAGSVTPGFEDTGYESKIPVSERDLGRENNRISDGLFFPKVVSF